MFNLTKSKKSNGSLTSAIVMLGFNLLIMFLLGLFKDKKTSKKPEKKKYIEGEIIE